MKNVIINQGQLDQIQLLIETKNSEINFLRYSLTEMTKQRDFFKSVVESPHHQMVREQLKRALEVIDQMKDNEFKMISEYDDLEDQFESCVIECSKYEEEVSILEKKIETAESYLKKCSDDLVLQKEITAKAISMLNQYNRQETLENADLSKILDIRG